MEEWRKNGWPLESGPAKPSRPGRSSLSRRLVTPPRRRYRPGGIVLAAIDSIAARSVGQVLASWLVMVLAAGFAMWGAVATGTGQLIELGTPIVADAHGLWTSLYFSIVTATSVGYGDVTPTGIVRPLAMTEAVLGLLIFGFVISKFLGRRQEELVEEIHRIAFEDRLDRVQMNLHFVLSELQVVTGMCAGLNEPPASGTARVESVVRVFVGELRTIHDLLYRPQQNPDEPVMEGILSNLAAAFAELEGLMTGPCGAGRRGIGLDRMLESIRGLASEICGECVPREYAPSLKELMDQIQAMARRMGTR